MPHINFKSKTHREVPGRVLTVEDIEKIGCTFLLFDKSEFVYIGGGRAYNSRFGERFVTTFFNEIKNVRKNNIIIGKRKAKERKLIAVKYVRKKKRKSSAEIR